MAFFDFLFKSTVKSQEQTKSLIQDQPKTAPASVKEEGHKVAGVKYYTDNLMKICSTNPDYKLTKAEIIKKNITNSIFEYKLESDNVELIPEPDNPHDPRAIKVVISGQHIGYVKKGSCGRIHNLLNSNSILKIQAFMHGGKCKYLTYSDNGNLILEHNETDFGIKLTITSKQQ